MPHGAAPENLPPPKAIEINTATLRRDFAAARRALGLSQTRAAQLLRVSQATISSFERDQYAAVRHETLLRIKRFVRRAQRTATASPDRRLVVRAAHRPRAPQCIWCAAPLPRMKESVRFCPRCGGRQSTAPSSGSLRCCISCGRPIEVRVSPPREPT